MQTSVPSQFNIRVPWVSGVRGAYPWFDHEPSTCGQAPRTPLAHGTQAHDQVQSNARFPFLALLALWLIASAAQAQAPAPKAQDDRTVVGGAKATVDVVLDQSTWSATEPIRGKLMFTLDSAVTRTNQKLDTVRFNGPRVMIEFPDDMAAMPLAIKWQFELPTVVQVGRRYELGFAIVVDEEVRKLLKAGDAAGPLYVPGKYRVTATVSSPTRAVDDAVSKSPFIELYQQFNSSGQAVIIEPAGRPISRDSVLALIEAADAAIKTRLIHFFIRPKTLTRDDVLKFVNASEGKAKAELASAYLNMGGSAGDLSFFTAADGAVKFKGIDQGTPVYLLVRPQQRVSFEFDLSEVHRFRLWKTDTVVSSRRQHALDAPQAEGVYEMYDAAHGKPWGWVLVHRGNADTATTTTTRLRPQTKELSAKVVEALMKADADALAALSAPGAKVADMIKQTRFKLGEGDIRYHESTGGENKVKTRMRINLAPAGKEPVFASELWLEFVRVGEELKLSNAVVMEAQR